MSDDGRISAFGVGLAGVPKWVVAVVALTLALAVVWKTVLEPRWERAAIQEDLDEFVRHLGEAPASAFTLMDDARGKWIAQQYASDGCVALVRVFNGDARTKIIRDFAGAAAPLRRSWLSALVAPVAAQGGRCPPHQGRFTQHVGARDGCWVPVTFIWEDTCAYVQYYNACSKSWDGNIRWVRCTH